MKKRVYSERDNVLKAKPVFYEVRSAPPLPPLPGGTPLLFWCLPPFESVNDIIYLSPKARAGVMKAGRELGYTTAIGYVQEQKLKLKFQTHNRKSVLRLTHPLTLSPLFCFVRVFRGDNRRHDIFNLAIKSFIDGCTDAGLWNDDNERYIPDFWAHYESGGNTAKVELSFYIKEEVG